MNITRLQIRNLRGIEHFEVDLRASDGHPRTRTILLGGNGCGKTTILLTVDMTGNTRRAEELDSVGINPEV